MKKNQIILISIGVLVAIGLAFGFYYWFQYSNEQQKTEIQKEISQEEAMKKETGGIIPEANYPAGGEKEIFLEPEREGGEKPNIE